MRAPLDVVVTVGPPGPAALDLATWVPAYVDLVLTLEFGPGTEPAPATPPSGHLRIVPGGES